MFKNTSYVIGLLLATVVVSAIVVKWLAPTPAPSDTSQMDQVLQGIKQQSASLSTLENNLKRLNTEVSRLDSKTTQLQNQASAVPTAAQPMTTATPTAIPEDRLAKVDQQLADLQQQLAALLANPNQAKDEPAPKPDPYAGMSKEQIQQQQALAEQQQQQQLASTITATADPGKTSQISSSFESYLATANIGGSPPKIECGSTLCRFQFSQANLRGSKGELLDPMLVLMESGTFPVDGTDRTIITQQTPQGGMDLYVGNADDFPKTPSQ
ncbi:hypothetical protein [uncultured Thiothrix sp.]|uniref:hypothetical protein n=1 Tax=uncultured Thiothrix sp. TaxID=223185 RepID=UPI002636A4BA|nr:hypothetical protein [uncultured Thiothrix sp.]HMT93820.1 hypothetical protein [Thiolinea sp.]